MGQSSMKPARCLSRSQVTNDFGIEWMRRHLGDEYRVHVLDFKARQQALGERVCPSALLAPDPRQVIKSVLSTGAPERREADRAFFGSAATGHESSKGAPARRPCRVRVRARRVEWGQVPVRYPLGPASFRPQGIPRGEHIRTILPQSLIAPPVPHPRRLVPSNDSRARRKRPRVSAKEKNTARDPRAGNARR